MPRLYLISWRLDASNYPTDGFYKLLTPAHKIGWVQTDLLDLTNPAPAQ
jgi:hypothetical protein